MYRRRHWDNTTLLPFSNSDVPFHHVAAINYQTIDLAQDFRHAPSFSGVAARSDVHHVAPNNLPRRNWLDVFEISFAQHSLAGPCLERPDAQAAS